MKLSVKSTEACYLIVLKLVNNRVFFKIFWRTFSFLKFLEDMSPFCGATDTPVLDW